MPDMVGNRDTMAGQSESTHPPSSATSATTAEGHDTAEQRSRREVEAEIRSVGMDLMRSLRELIERMPDAPQSPSALSRAVGINRVIVSRLMTAINRDDVFEALHQIPGPESIRTFANASSGLGVPDSVVADVLVAAERFATLIRDEFSTRSALNAAISAKSERLQRQFEESSRYHIFKGMRQVLGVSASTWLNASFFVPHPTDPEFNQVTTIHGALGMRRLRPDANVVFSFGAPFPIDDPSDGLASGGIDLDSCCVHPPAVLKSEINGQQIVHHLDNDAIGKDAEVDMLAVGHNDRGSRRYATLEQPLRGISLFPDVPVKTMICDLWVHEDLFPDLRPQLLVYNPGVRGPADPNNPLRDIDRIEVQDEVEVLGRQEDRLELSEVPNYPRIVERVCDRIGLRPNVFRVCRVRVVYPVHGFQYVIACPAPLPGSDAE